jgi:acyl carrier protein phosphodiesterase
MYSKSKIKNSYYDLKEIFREIKERNYKKKYKETDRFVDVSDELAEQDRIGKVKKNDYMDYYLSVKSNRQIKDEVQPSGVTAKNKNYDYANAKFVESLE